MNFNVQKTLSLSLILLSFAPILSNIKEINQNGANRRKHIGMFKPSDRQLSGIVYGNWGSRPYEYFWASQIVSVEGKKVIDLGTGIPSQYNWYSYVVSTLKPAFYSGIDWDGRILNELISQENYEMRHMNMADLQYPDKEFDTAFCISTYEHIPYTIFMKSMQETHRVLKDDGVLIITLDEEWDKNALQEHANSWNELEKSLEVNGMFKRHNKSFGLPEFLELIKDYFVLVQDDAVIDHTSQSIISNKDGYVYYHRNNRDHAIINSGDVVNSCVSYAVLKKKSV